MTLHIFSIITKERSVNWLTFWEIHEMNALNTD